MNRVEAAGVLDRLGVAYAKPVPEEAIDLWADQLGAVDVDVVIDAVENVIGIEAFFPTIAVVRNEIAAVHRQRARERLAAPPADGGPDRGCQTCHGLVWYEVEPVQVANQRTGEVTHDTQWKPCHACGPEQYAIWCSYADDRRSRVARKARKPESFVADISSLLAEAREALKAGSK